MTIDTEFLFDNKLIAELENLIKNSKKELLLVSPFIDLDKRIMDTLNSKKKLANFRLRILFGKNENNIYKSIKNNSLDFLKQFPNVEIRYEERLHAKFYLNDTQFILTSLNLYDYSLAKNIECGILVNHSSKGIIGKFLDEGNNLIHSGVSKVKNDVFGLENNEIDPIDKFESIFINSKLLYKTEPILAEAKGLAKFIKNKEIKDHNIIVDELDLQKEGAKKIEKKKEYKLLSASKLSKLLKIDQKQLLALFEKERFIKGNEILEKGIKYGLVYNKYMGRDYIAFPDNLEILNNIKE